MSNTHPDLNYAKSHEWVKQLADDIIEVGISDYAQESLGDVVYVELPQVGSEVEAGQECCAVESVKAASDIYAPMSGEIVEVNDALEDEPELLNQSPYEGGWMFRIKVTDSSQIDDLMDASAYESSIEA
ncbi:MAG: glycine cleavage system protein GcvH [Arenicella sp.]